MTSDKNFFLGISRFKNKDAPLGHCHWWFNVYTGSGNPWENILYHGDIHFCSHRPESEMANKKAAVFVKVFILFIINYNFFIEEGICRLISRIKLHTHQSMYTNFFMVTLGPESSFLGSAYKQGKMVFGKYGWIKQYR